MADTDCEDDRVDVESRDRLDELRASWDDTVERLERRYRIVGRMNIAACVLALSTLAVVAVVVRHEARQRQNTQLRAIAYRVCQREAVNRAYEQSTVAPSRRPYVEKNLPILDCTPNLSGEPATPFTIDMQRQFVAKFVRSELTSREQGICRERIPDEPDEPVC